MNRPVAKSPRPILISPVLPRQWLAAGLWGVTAMTLTATGVRAQPICTSEAAPPARHWQERFVPADCGDCWTAPDTAPTEAGAIVLDWVVPGTLGDDAPLSAVARRESVERLDTVGMPPPRRPTARSEALPQMPPFRLRLGRGGGGVACAKSRMLRGLTRCGCLSEARSAQRVPQRTPPASRPRCAPTRSVGVADCGARFFGYFLAARQESTSPAGASPGPGKQTHDKHKNSQKPKVSKR